ncbi:unnamed protein product [Ranitomeya imitator]|uniref:Uncharacterized protein n=1 Tax=Ranitomeya imitator TaxID=111125 RepID=A0ABN9MDR1_9NEOB|nr:unnamed protein product [Ranitomeya imitator]
MTILTLNPASWVRHIGCKPYYVNQFYAERVTCFYTTKAISQRETLRSSTRWKQAVGGAGGLELATNWVKNWEKARKRKITLVDRIPYHLWKPLLHEVATGSLDEGVDALSYLAHARNHHFQFQLLFSGRYQSRK